MGKLAIEGGKSVGENLFPPRILFDEKEKQVVLKIIKKT